MQLARCRECRLFLDVLDQLALRPNPKTDRALAAEKASMVALIAL
jgi:hypothetical protein